MKTDLLGPLEQKIMNVLWKSALPLKPRDVQEKLKSNYAYTTVMTILKRLVEKKLLKRELEGRVYYYYSLSDHQKFVESNLKDIYGDLVDSYGKLAISQFVNVIKNNKGDMKLLKEYLDANQ